MFFEIIKLKGKEQNNENQRAKVNVEMFGRETPVDLDFDQIRKIND